MEKIHAQREIIERKALIADLQRSLASQASTALRRACVLDVFKKALAQGRDEIARRFERSNHGGAVVHEYCFLIDQLIRILYDQAFLEVGAPDASVAVVAVGGYGRGELAPYSDIDLLFLLPSQKTPQAEAVVEYMLYILWDLGLKVGHATRSIEECLRQARADLTIRTALLEMRWLWGGQAVFHELQRKFRADIASTGAEAFVEGKLAERDKRHATMGDSRYVLEPNVKEGKGGLRDLHTLYWIAKYLYGVQDISELAAQNLLSADAVSRFAKAQEFLWTVRCHVHYLAGRAEERLTFDMQQEIGRRMGYTDHAGTRGVERFMKHYFLTAKIVGDLTRIFCALLEEQNARKPRSRMFSRWVFTRRSHVDGFLVEGKRLTIEHDDDFIRHPLRMIELFHAALEHDLDIHPKALSAVTQNLKKIDAKLRADPRANALFMEMLTSRKAPEAALRRMNEAGVLGRFIPDFGRVLAQMQYDMYHVYTVDEHTIQAVGILNKLEKGELAEQAPAASEVVGKVLSRRVLYLAVFLHDIAKGRGGDHSVLGEAVARKLGPRLGLSEEETETTSWLVRHHLLMSQTAFKRDIDDPKTLYDFIAIVQSPERLRLLLCLTVADIRAVGPNVWNNWKAGLLRELYCRAYEMMLGGLSVARQPARIEMAQNALREALRDWPAEDIEAQIARAYPSYWVSFDTATQVRHARMMRQAERSALPLVIEHRIDADHSVTEIVIYASDHAGLFSQIAGAMAISGATIVDAKIMTMANGMALDTFLIQDGKGHAFDQPSKLAKLSATIERALSGRLRAREELARHRPALPSRTQVFKVPPRVLIDNKASATHTLIEVNGRDRVGLLYEVTSAMTRCNVQIFSAHISTYGERVVDVFYVKDLFGLKIEHEGKIRQIREALMSVLV